MANWFSRIFSSPQKRSLDAAAVGRRWSGAKVINNLNADLLSGNRTIQPRASYVARNNAYITSAANALVTNIAGPGIKPSSQHPDPATREHLHSLWDRTCDTIDVTGNGDFYALQATLIRQMIEIGEGMARFVHDGPVAGNEVPIGLQPIHPSQVPYDVPMLANGRIVAGVEHDEWGRPEAYFVTPTRPGDPTAPLGDLWHPVRVGASEFVHLFNPVEPGQVRGLSWLAPVMLAVSELDQLNDAALVRAKLANLVCAALVTSDGDTAGLTGDVNDGVLDAALEPGSIIPLKPGASLEFFDPKESQNYPEFIRVHLQQIAAGIGIPYEMLTGDLSQVNYSSIRAGLVEFKKRLEHWQHNVVVYKLCRPVWNRFITTAVLSGAIDRAAYAADPAAFHKVSWLPPRQPWVDPESDAKAEILMVSAGFKTRSQVVAGLGYDPEAIDRENAADAERAKSFGLTYSALSGQPQTAKPTEKPANA